jgi:hypothetical protein
LLARVRHDVLCLIPILLIAAVLRLWGLGFGLPNTATRPDEGRLVGIAAGFTLKRNLNPHFFSYPTLYPYVVGSLYAGWCAGGVAIRAFPSMSACSATWLEDWSPLFLTSRTLSALAGVGAVALVFFIGRRFHQAAGPLGALFLGVAFLHVRDSHFGTTDVPMTSMLLVALLLLLRADEQPSAGRFALAGLAAGLAASTKYNALLLGAAVVVSQAFAWLADRGAARARHTRLVWFGIPAVAGFLAGTPFALLQRAEFLEHTRSELWHLMEWGTRIPLGIGWRYHALVTLPQGVGWPLLLAGLAGMIWMLASRPRAAAIIFSFPLIYYVVAGRGTTVFVRYMIPVVPFLCLGAGALIASAYVAVARRHQSVARAIAAGLVVLCAVPTAVKAIALDRVLSQTDSRVLATDWMAQHVAPNSTVLATGGGIQLYKAGKWLPFRALIWETDVLGPQHAEPDWIIVERSPLYRYSLVPEGLTAILDQYALRHTVTALTLNEPHVYDQQDAFYLPIDGFRGIQRPGPNLLIYQRR